MLWDAFAINTAIVFCSGDGGSGDKVAIDTAFASIGDDFSVRAALVSYSFCVVWRVFMVDAVAAIISFDDTVAVLTAFGW